MLGVEAVAPLSPAWLELLRSLATDDETDSDVVRRASAALAAQTAAPTGGARPRKRRT